MQTFPTSSLCHVALKILHTFEPLPYATCTCWVIATEWHPTKNGKLKPTDVSAGSIKKVWWMLPYDDSKTDKHFDFEWEASISHRAKGVSCPQIKSSKMERLAYDIIKNMGIDFKTEKKFANCKDRKMLPFDIFIESKMKIIELDGIQHFIPIDAWGGEERFLIYKNHDKIKNEFCSKNDIKLLRIPYIYDADNDKDEIIDIIESFINYGIIPNKIRDFYKKEQRNSYITILKSYSVSHDI